VAADVGTGPQVIVAGEALIDLIVHPGGEITPLTGGSPYNSVRAIARLGIPAAFVGGLSSDRFGRQLEAGLVADGVQCDRVQRTDLPTTLALAELAPDGSASYRFYVDATSAPAVVPGPLSGGLPATVRALLTGSLGLVLEPMADTLEGVVVDAPADRLVMLDPNARPSITRDPVAWRARMARVIARADIVRASTEDLDYLYPGDPIDAAARRVLGQGPAVVLATDGSRPVRVLTAAGTELVPAPLVDVVDTVGAGDTFGGAFLGCLVHDGIRPADLADPAIAFAAAVRAARFAVLASAAVCAREGADPPTLAELGGWPPA
jgi:fructokinase